jgi:uncharacterized membrane protein (UPF0136 family)
MIVRAKIPPMSRVTRALSLVLLAAGVVFVFAGVNLAVGWSAIGVVSSTAAVAALLYSGAIWFGSSAKPNPHALDTIVVFDRSLRVASGALRGVNLTSCFPSAIRADLEAHCVAALGGAGARFSCGSGGDRRQFDAVPVRAADGGIVYGLLMGDVRITSPAGSTEPA